MNFLFLLFPVTRRNCTALLAPALASVEAVRLSGEQMKDNPEKWKVRVMSQGAVWG